MVDMRRIPNRKSGRPPSIHRMSGPTDYKNIRLIRLSLLSHTSNVQYTRTEVLNPWNDLITQSKGRDSITESSYPFSQSQRFKAEIARREIGSHSDCVFTNIHPRNRQTPKQYNVLVELTEVTEFDATPQNHYQLIKTEMFIIKFLNFLLPY